MENRERVTEHISLVEAVANQLERNGEEFLINRGEDPKVTD